jgi:hypothetical protein
MNRIIRCSLPIAFLVLSHSLAPAAVDKDDAPKNPLNVIPGHSATGIVVKEAGDELWLDVSDPCSGKPKILVFVKPYTIPKDADAIECDGKTYQRKSVTQK